MEILWPAHVHVLLNLDLGDQDGNLTGHVRSRGWGANRCVPSFLSGLRDDMAQPDDDQTEGDSHRWAGLWGFKEMSTRTRGGWGW